MSRFYKMYLSSSKVYLLNHFKSLSQAAQDYGLQVQLDGITLEVQVIHNNFEFKLFPQFLEINYDRPSYSLKLSDQSVCFIGWRPYQFVGIPTFKDKLDFKRLLADSDIAVPEYTQDSECDWEDVIVKSRQGSFGEGIKGPFKNALSYRLNSNGCEYFEKFIVGQVVKILYLNEIPIFLEYHDMPRLVGDGNATILQLANKRAKARDRSIDEFKLNEILMYQDLHFDDVLPVHNSMLADFRYESDLLPCYAVQEVELASAADCTYYNELQNIGALLYAHIRKEVTHDYFYTVDAILANDQKLWILEANPNPTVHQSGYRHLLALKVSSDQRRIS